MSEGPTQPSVSLGEAGIKIDGEHHFFFGGELQYFRVRDPHHSVSMTHALWRKGLRAMRAAGMNWLSTYVPWDAHEAAPGRFDFGGILDLDLFLHMASDEGLFVHIKPGPFINSEWPYGIGSFGAVPDWFRRDFPQSLALGPKGRPFSFHPLGLASGRQPSLLDSTFLDRVRQWFAALAPILKRHIGQRPGIAALQLDNECNLFFADRASLDFHPAAKAFAESWRSKNKPSDGAAADFGLGQGMILEFLSRLRGFWEELGIREPDLLFTTNDSPHILFESVRHLPWDAAIKNHPRTGVATLDLYPKQWPLAPALLDVPFLVEAWTKLFDQGKRALGHEGRFALSAELQGGMFETPLGSIRVKPEVTDQVMLKSVGHGLSLASFYVVHGGLNRDGSHYDFQAALGPSGERRPRYRVFAKWGRMLDRYRHYFLGSQPCEDSVLILLDPHHLVPRPGTVELATATYAHGGAALWGWLASAGYDAAVGDARWVSDEALAAYRAIVVADPGSMGGDVVDRLARWADAGGHLIHVGALSPDFAARLLHGESAPVAAHRG